MKPTIAPEEMDDWMMHPILFIVEKNLINGESYFGSSNDLLLIFEAIKSGLQVYLTTPHDIALNRQNFSSYPALKLSNLNQKKIAQEIKIAWKKQVVNAILALRFEASAEEKQKSKILFENAKIENINLYQINIFNRAEPISLTDEFYKILISIQKDGAKILPDPSLNCVLGDKLLVHAIHENLQIEGVKILDENLAKNNAHKISFESKFIKISNNDLSAINTRKFYDLLISKNFKKAEENFPQEYKIFQEGVLEYLKFHQKLANDSVIKPARYFGGVGVVVAPNEILDFEKAVQNICKSYLAILDDCIKSDHAELAFLPEIIVQERAQMAYLGDLRIVLSYGDLQGIFIRVNPDFEKSKANNLHFGGHPESLFKSYAISPQGIDLMMKELTSEEELRAKALYGLIEKIQLLQNIKLLKSYPIIGVDALLSIDKNGNYFYGINEINLTSPMGQVQLIILQIAVELNDAALDILKDKGVLIKLEKHQIIADFFKNADEKIINTAKEILLENKQLQSLIEGKIDNQLKNNLATHALFNQ